MDSSIPKSEIRNPKSSVPSSVARIRRQQCAAANCPHTPDYSDGCAECPEGHWGRFSRDCAPSLPSLAERAKNLAIATLQETAARLGGVPEITEEEALRRQSICFGIAILAIRPKLQLGAELSGEAPASRCQYLTNEGECSLCGCPMRRKTWWRSQHCPVGKW